MPAQANVPLQLTALIERGALTVNFALRNPLDVDVYLDQFEPTRSWPPERLHLLHPVPALWRRDRFDRPFDPARDIMHAPPW